MKLYISKATLRTIEKFGNASLTHISATPSDHMSVELDATPLANEASKPAAPVGWRFNVGSSDDRIWLTVTTPYGASASLSCAGRHDNGGTIQGQVLMALKEALDAPAAPSVEQDERGAFEAWMRNCEGYPYAGQYANLMWKAWQARAASTSANVAQGWRLVPERITDAMIESAMEAHYGKRRVRAHGGATGIAMTVDEKDYNGYDAMRRFWKGALAAAPAQSANVAQGAVAPDGRVVDKAMVKRLAVQYGLLPEQTALTDDSRDGARYRWLRDWYLRGGLRAEIHPVGHIVQTTPAIVDASIDAALTAAQSASGDTE